MSSQESRDVANGVLTTLAAKVAPEALPGLIAQLRAIPVPKGDAAQLAMWAAGFKKLGEMVHEVSLDLNGLAQRNLPEVWAGSAASLAGDVVVAASTDLEDASEVFTRADQVLFQFESALKQALDKHRMASDLLNSAADAHAAGSFQQCADHLHVAGGDLVASMNHAITGGEQARRSFQKLAQEANAHQLSGTGMSAADRLAIAEASGSVGDDENLILGKDDTRRANLRLAALSPEEQTAFTAMMAQSASPDGKAYLLKALAAGHNMSEISEFNAKIQPHSGDQEWLRKNLGAPITHGKKGETGWSQGDKPTCVASSTVVARAMVDPMYALDVNSGDKPLQSEQQRVYDTGRQGRDPGDSGGGMYDEEGQRVANSEIGKYNGQNYSSVTTNNEADRRIALDQIRDSVDQHKPVPFLVTGGDGMDHQMMIVGRHGGQLEIFNPWGDVTTVSEDQFANGQMNYTDGVPPNVRRVLVPQ